MGAIKIIAWIRLYGIPELLIFYTSYSALKDMKEIDTSLDMTLRVVALIAGIAYAVYRWVGLEIDNRRKTVELLIKEAELKSIELDNQLKEKEQKK